VRGRYLLEQLTEPLTGQESALGELPTPATATPGQRKCLNELWFDKPLSGRRLQAQAQRSERVADRAIREPWSSTPGTIC